MGRQSSRRYGRTLSRQGKTCQERCKDFLRHFVAFMFTNVGIVGLVVAYTIAGAFMFIAIEGEEAETLLEEVMRMRNNTVDSLWEYTVREHIDKMVWTDNVTAKLKGYQHKFVDKIRSGYDPKLADSWSFSGAFLYSLTVITTIGYGNVAPRTDWGKLATIVYAIAGMPLFLLYLSNIGDILAKSFKWIYCKVCLCRGCPGTASFRRKRMQMMEMNRVQASVANTQQQDWQVEEGQSPKGSRKSKYRSEETEDEDSDDEESENEDEDDDDDEEDGSSYEDEDDPQAVTVPILLCLGIMVGYVYGGALLFAPWEQWNILDSSYFCFISLSTIGFGDFVPGVAVYESEAIQLRFILTAVYLMLGMALIAMCFNLMQEEVLHKARTCMKLCRHIFRCTSQQSMD